VVASSDVTSWRVTLPVEVSVLVAILSVLWFFAVSRFLRANAWGEEQSSAD
jgi:hypothetical protein